MIYKRKVLLLLAGLMGMMVATSASPSCPVSCTCRHRTVRCTAASRHTLARVPPLTQHLYLSSSSVPSLGPGDLPALPHLTSLSLANTGLNTILPGAFKQAGRLERLDLSYNNLRELDSATLGSLSNLLVLKVNNNQLVCISPSVASLSSLEVLSIQHNLLPNLPSSLASLERLRQLRLDRNRLHCDCNINWLASFLRRRPSLGLGASCRSPTNLSGNSISALMSHQLKCNGPSVSSSQECGAEQRCPQSCKCARGTVDCRSLGLTKVPSELPADTKELRLERNLIEEIPPFAFRGAPSLRRIDLSRNRLTSVSSEAFTYNRQLTTLILYDNQLPSLPQSSLVGLPDLQMILLNKNNISCLPQRLFNDQKNLILLSLYDNKLRGLPDRIFAPLKALATLHLGANPWQCSCPLLWLSSFLVGREVGGAGAACASPQRLRGIQLEAMTPDQFECSDATRTHSYHPETCDSEENCPAGCLCSGSTTDCRGAGFRTLPLLPPATSTLLLDRNRLTEATHLGRACAQLPNLSKISARHNSIGSLDPTDVEGCNHLDQLDLSYNRLATLTGAFDGLTNLVRLGLIGNELACIDRQALDSLHRVREVEVDLRYLQCNCANNFVRDWMLQRRAKVVNYNCQAAASSCPSASQAASLSCPINSPCPEGCSCKGSVMQCSRLGLILPPSPVPLLATELHLSHNSITLTNNTTMDQSLVRLILLDLSYNAIEQLGPDSLPHLPNLKTLLLNNNRIQCITGGAFRRLPQLSSLALQHNDIAGLKRTVFSSVASLTSVQLEGNPLHCDCRLEWLAVWLSSKVSSKPASVTISRASCASPALLNGRLLSSVPASTLVCTGNPRDPVQARCDPCFSSPCQHGGLCLKGSNPSRPGDRFTCQCNSLYTGNRCEVRRDPCVDSPCRNGGRCRSRRGEVFCTCPPGWEGARCETNTDDCVNHVCQNGGICRDRTAGYSCSCVSGWGGQYCQEPPLPLPSPRTPFEDHCSLCQHGARCSSPTIGPPSCVCPPGYSGVFCESSPSVEVAAYQQASPCQAAPCRHGTCLASSPSTYACQCHPGYSGKRCEYLTTVQLAGANPYIQLDPLYTSRPLNLTLVVKTRESAGVLLYHGNSDHLAVELFHGRVRVSLNVGNPPASTMFSYAVLNDDKPHAVELLLDGKNLTMRVDGGLARSLINLGSQEVLTVASPTYLGGLPEEVGEAALSNWHIRNSTSLRGCVNNFYIDDKTIDFLQAAHRRPGVLAGCYQRYLTSALTLADSETGVDWRPTMKKESLIRDGISRKDRRGKTRGGKKRNGCDGHRCRETGTRGCSPREGGNYRCKCKRGFAGRYCERAPSCRKKKVKQFLKENGCRSRKLVRETACQGECHGNSCCKARKTKKKKVGMICEDGTRYVKTVEVARKCVCGKAKSSTCPASNYKNLLSGGG